jgi:hypothetical protein
MDGNIETYPCVYVYSIADAGFGPGVGPHPARLFYFFSIWGFPSSASVKRGTHSLLYAPVCRLRCGRGSS